MFELHLIEANNKKRCSIENNYAAIYILYIVIRSFVQNYNDERFKHIYE